MIDAKDTDGTLLFLRIGAGEGNGRRRGAYSNFAQAIQKIHDNGLSVIARVQCFRDPLAARRLGEGSAVCYQRPGTLWLDNSADKGGKPWANPYSETVQSYLTGLIGELTAMEIDSILLDSVQFPSGYALNKTYYIGESESGVSRNDVLKNFVASAKQAAGSKNVILSNQGKGPSAVEKASIMAVCLEAAPMFMRRICACLGSKEALQSAENHSRPQRIRPFSLRPLGSS